MSKSELCAYADHTIYSLVELEETYGPANPVSLVKEIGYISDHFRAFIEKSPFVVLATVGPDGVDCPPRGDPPGFARVLDEHAVAIPDRCCNNRIDNLRNLVVDPRASLLFLIPGIGETLRINGRGYIGTEPELRASFEMQGKVPATSILVKVDSIYFQCLKALVRSKLWQADSQFVRSELPMNGMIISTLSQEFDGDEYNLNYPKRLLKTSTRPLLHARWCN